MLRMLDSKVEPKFWLKKGEKQKFIANWGQKQGIHITKNK